MMDRADPARVIAVARSFLATPYRHQASCPGAGADCLGLVRAVWRDIVGPEPEGFRAYARDWAETLGEERLMDLARRHLLPRSGAAEPGDILLLRWRRGLPASHLVILCGPSVIIHAADPVGVVAVPLGPWKKRIAGVFSFPARSVPRHPS
ncbi:MAG: peptidase P60 [Hyphomicrobiaceae bacterium]|nr:peptidase P60 [Hyphomicrobiaceae bacterium]